jgi:hypothetical protein
MIYGYFDESGESGDGFFVVAGFVGRRKDWKNFLRMWQKELGDRPSLHLASMRLGAPQAPKRHGELLVRLGSIPHRANLHGFAGSVRTTDYAEKIKGTIAEIGLSGYSVALVAMVDAILESKTISKRDRMEFTFEDQIEFAVPRAATFRTLRLGEQYKTHHGKSRVGKDSAMAASPLLEAADYLSYAILQQLIDPNSQKAKLTAPILEASQPIAHVEITKDNVEQLIKHVYFDYGEEIPEMDRRKRAYIIEKMKNSLKA